MYIYKRKMEAEEKGQKEMCLWMTLSEKASTGYFALKMEIGGHEQMKVSNLWKLEKARNHFVP